MGGSDTVGHEKGACHFSHGGCTWCHHKSLVKCIQWLGIKVSTQFLQKTTLVLLQYCRHCKDPNETARYDHRRMYATDPWLFVINHSYGEYLHNISPGRQEMIILIIIITFF